MVDSASAPPPGPQGSPEPEVPEGPALQPAEPAVEFTDTGISTGIEAEDIGEAGRMPFDPELIDVAPRNPTIDLVLQRLKRGLIDLQPDFQHRSGIWNDTAQSRLIESLLLRIALPTLYVAEEADESWSVVDGVQRLTSIVRFVKPEAAGLKPLRLENLEYLTRYDGARFDDLPGRMQTHILESELSVLLIRKGTPEEARFNIFARINTGGLPLSQQELRHALIPGRARTFLARLAESEQFLDATAHSVSPARMAERRGRQERLRHLPLPRGPLPQRLHEAGHPHYRPAAKPGQDPGVGRPGPEGRIQRGPRPRVRLLRPPTPRTTRQRAGRRGRAVTDDLASNGCVIGRRSRVFTLRAMPRAAAREIRSPSLPLHPSSV
ncbi:DUF262 domain-containing protein [Streptomyces sp. NPDC047860]|uniref:DUF262 domain-containing protein n=1 Tax=Streptomyces sp. NPDC047860 TaxID=3155743 RepID=UPI0033C00A5B